MAARIWLREQWTDKEPDTFSAIVKSAANDSEKFLVVSGNSTWLSLEQAKELRAFLDEAIDLMEED